MSDVRGYGVVQVSGVYLGIGIDALIEAVEWPSDVSPHPTVRGVLRGVFTLRGKAIPLVDLRSFFDTTAMGSASTALVAIINYNGSFLGIAIDAVCGILKATDGEPCRLVSGDSTSALLPTLILSGDTQRKIYILDIGYLAALPEVLLTSTMGPEIHRQAIRTREALRHFLVFECDGRHFCIDASVVTELVDKPDISPTDFGNERCFGTVEMRGRKIPALSLSHMLEFESGALATKDQLLLLTAPDGRVAGFGYDRMVAILRHAPSSLLPLPSYGLREPDLLSGVMNLHDGKQALVLSHNSLLERPEVRSYATIFQQEVVSARETHQAARSAHRQACLLFHAPLHFAAPLYQIAEILELPSDLIRIHQAENHLLGQFHLRGEQVPLICLSSLIESSPQSPTASSRVLVVRGNHSLFGFAVCRVDAIDSFRDFNPTQLERSYQGNGGKAKSVNDRVRSLVSIGTSDQSWRATLLDLRSLAIQLENSCETLASA